MISAQFYVVEFSSKPNKYAEPKVYVEQKHDKCIGHNIPPFLYQKAEKRVSEKKSSINLPIKETITEPCLEHEAVVEFGKFSEFELKGFSASANLRYVSMKLLVSKNKRTLLITPQRILDSSKIR
ncbi:hypothetical protein CDAR_85151 [Caerostris darwini]|uniref:Uncharacterized protein n=1 Tax=Caerostris darwini TaxID=1538125 RepID=A0AAV4MZ55_9ARAC|nr:hypothetical protein CDAR_85151 [Caerostris darwini]